MADMDEVTLTLPEQESEEPDPKRQRVDTSYAVDGMPAHPHDLAAQGLASQLQQHDPHLQHHLEQHHQHHDQHHQHPDHHDLGHHDEQNVDAITALLAAGAAAADPSAMPDNVGDEVHIDIEGQDVGDIHIPLQKECSNCHVTKPSTEFHREERNPDQLSNKCKECRRSNLKQHPEPTVTEKVCKKCGILKYASEFCKSKWGVDGLHSRCKSCIRDALPITEMPTVKRKHCSKCHQEKEAQDFDRYKRTADGLQSQCKVCMKAARTTVPVPTVAEKRCTKCRETKPATEFFRFKFSSDGLQSYCKSCKNASRAKNAAIQAEKKAAAIVAAVSAVHVENAQHAQQMGLPVPQLQLQGQMPMEAAPVGMFAPGLMAGDPNMAVSQGLPPGGVQDPNMWNAAVMQQPAMQQPQLQLPPEEERHKTCPRCQHTKPHSQFRPVNKSPDGVSIMCRQCEQDAQANAIIGHQTGTTPTEKACSKCHQVQPAEQFYRNKHTTDRLESQCKACKRSALQNTPNPTVSEKKCSKCNETKLAVNFDRYKRTSDGLQSQCKDCMKAARPVVKMPQVVSKACSKCHQDKPASEFFRREQSHDGLQSWCRACKNAARQASEPRNSSAAAAAGGAHAVAQQDALQGGDMLADVHAQQYAVQPGAHMVADGQQATYAQLAAGQELQQLQPGYEHAEHAQQHVLEAHQHQHHHQPDAQQVHHTDSQHVQMQQLEVSQGQQLHPEHHMQQLHQMDAHQLEQHQHLHLQPMPQLLDGQQVHHADQLHDQHQHQPPDGHQQHLEQHHHHQHMEVPPAPLQ